MVIRGNQRSIIQAYYLSPFITIKLLLVPNFFSECDVRTDISNGSVNVTPGISGRWSYSAVAEFSCNTGFILSHNSSSHCVENGQWNVTEPICEIQECQLPSQPINGAVDLINGTHTYLDVLMYRCDIGFDLIGPEYRTCLSSGEWSGVNTQCELVDCGRNITVPEHGHVIYGNVTTFGNSAFVNCSEGYTLDGWHTLNCASDGTWSPQVSDPSCIAIGRIIIYVFINNKL